MYCNCEEKWIETKQDRNYQISSKGRVWSCYSNKVRKLQKDRKGYLCIDLGKKGHQIKYRIHNLITTNFIGEYPNGMDIEHKNQIKTHNCLCNLIYLSKSDNQKNKEWSNKKGYIRSKKFHYRIDKEDMKIRCETKQEAKDLQDCYICIQNIKEQVFSLYKDDLLSTHH